MDIITFLSGRAFRIGVLAVTVFATISIFYLTVGTKPCLDLAPDLRPITPAKYNNWGQYADTIKLGFYGTSLAISDFSQGFIQLDGILWVQFNPLVFSTETVSNFSVDKGRLLEKELIGSSKIGEELFLSYRVRLEAKSNLNFKYYPLDSHRIHIVIKYDDLSPSEVITTMTFSRVWLGYNAVSANWKYRQPAANYGYLESELDSRGRNDISLVSAAGLFFDFERATLREAYVVFGLYLIMLFIILASFLMSFTSFQMVIISIMCIVGMILQRIVVGSMSALTSYFLLSDCVFYWALMCALLILVTQIMSALYNAEAAWWYDLARSAVVAVFSMLFLVGWFYLLYIW